MGQENIYYCIGCGTTHQRKDFYKSYNSNHKNGVYPFCKKYIKKESYMEDGSINVKKFKNLLMQMDAPFLESEFKGAVEDKRETIGTYFSRIKTPQNRGYTWKDSDLGKNVNSSKEEDVKEKGTANESCTIEDKNKMTYSKKWRGKYPKADLEYLDDYYRDLQLDFKIVTKNHKDYAKKIAKASLAMDKAYENMINDVSGSDKKYKDLKDVFDSLSKSAQFSENTRGQNDVSLGCFGVVFDKVEQKKWIPQHTPLKKDDYDKLIEYFSTIEKSI